MNLFELFAKVSLDTTEYEREVGNVTKSGESLGSKLKSGLATAGGIAAKGIGLIAGAATAAGGALLALEANTEEYRVAQGKLNTAFEAAGFSADAAQEAYRGFYEILGDTDTATEASQLLAKLVENEADVVDWTDIAAGVYGTFGDSLPIEGLIEASNETAKVGQVTGVLADALNWAGISEDEFNEKLAACSNESERNALITETLYNTYDKAASAFYKNNRALVDARMAQVEMDAALGKLGESVSNVKTRLMGEFLPGIAAVAEGLAGMLSGTEGAEEQFSTAIGGLINTAVARLPEFLNFGVQILTALLTGIVQNIPVLVQAIPQVVQSIYTAFQTLWPTIQTIGTELLTMLGNGILIYVPQLVAQLPTVIMAILNFLTQNLPQFLQKGTEFIVNLTNGIMQQIPGMVAQLPQIISSFMSFIAANLPQILQSGIQILLSLASGIIQAIPSLVSQLPAVMSAIVSGFGSLMGNMLAVGRNIVQGIWNGISGSISWLVGKIGGFANSVVSSVKGFFGIHSPSTVFRDEVGKNIGLGIAAGLDDSKDDALKAANELAKSVYDKSKEWLDKQVKYQKYSLRQQLEVWDAIQQQFVSNSQQYADAEEQILDLREKILQENLDLEEEYQKQLSDVTNEIFDSYGLFESVPESEKVSGDKLIQNLEGQINSIESFYANLDELYNRGVGMDLVDEIASMGVGASDQLSALLALSDEKLTQYADLFYEKQALANDLAIEQLAGLRAETDKEVQANLDAINGIYESEAPEVGQSLTDGLADGITSGTSTVIAAAVGVATAAIQAAKNALGVHSPSTVFAGIGKNMAVGLANGWEGEYKSVKDAITSGMDFGTASVDFASSGLGVSSAGIVNGLSGAAQSGGTYTFNLLLPDGTKLASYMLKPLADYARANGTPILNPT